MAQYIDTSLISNSEFWDATRWRTMCKELAGLRGLAPAVHFRNPINDANASLYVEDDRIFKIHTHNRVYVWGVEMYAGGYDTIKIYWRSTAPDSTWSLDSDWKLIKGAGAYDTDLFNIANNNPVSNPNTGTPEATLSSTGTGLHFPQSTPDPMGVNDPASNIYFYDNWIVEMLHSGNMYGMAGPSPTYDSGGKSYTTKASNFLRCFMFLKEGYWKIVLDETASKWYIPNDGDPPDVDSNWFNTNGRLSAVDYVSNPVLYGSMPGHVDANKNIQVLSNDVRYRSGFTRTLNIQAFKPEKDLVDDNTFTVVNKTLPTRTVGNNYIITEPYTRVTGYGSEWGSSLLDHKDTQDKRFIKTQNSSGQDGTAQNPNTSIIGSLERFGNVEWRHTTSFIKRTINRRHLYLDGVTISSSQKAVHIWDIAPTEVNTEAPSNPFAGINGLAKGWLVDFRGSVFKNCTFKNVIIGSSSQSCWSGCSFVNCKFLNCSVSVSGDSILFAECSFSGCAPDNYSMFGSESFTSCAVISCQFISNDRTLSFESIKGPISNNLFWRNIFDGSVNSNGGSELIIVKFPQYKRENAQKFCFEATGLTDIEYIAQQHEYSRNMYVFNRFFGSVHGNVSALSTFSRANFFYSNTFDGISIAPVNPDVQDKCLYESWAHNSINKISIVLDARTYHFRFLLNSIGEPHKHGDKNSSNSYIRTAGEKYPWIAAQDGAVSGEWYCPNSTSMANKIIKNTISNWGDFYMDNAKGSCSAFQNFHHVYDPDFDITISNDSYWGVGDKWKYVNIAHRNFFLSPQPCRQSGWSDGDIGRLNLDGSPYTAENVSGVRMFSAMPLEWPQMGWTIDSKGAVSWARWEDKCSQTPSDIIDRELCRSIYVKSTVSSLWEIKNYGSVSWESQIFRTSGSLP